ncbi:MAG: BNR-4 repeat-containing protein [Flavitalea sp.]
MKYLLLLCIGLFLFQLVSAQEKSRNAEEYKLVAEDGAWCWFSDPRAVYYKGSHNRIYYSYINSKGDVMISARDLRTKVIETFTLHEKLEIDDHDVASILFLPDGRLLTFYTEHNGISFSRKSRNPEDITSWEEERVLAFNGDRITYSHPVMLSEEKNRIYLFWRGRNAKPAPGFFNDWRQYFSYSDDGGDTWAAAKNYIDNEGLNNPPYLKASGDGRSRIDFAFTVGHPGVGAEISLYHMYYEKGAFYQTNGEKIAALEELPLALTQVHKVYDYQQGKVRSWISDVALDKNKRPAIAYMRYPSADDHRYYYAYWNGKSWVDEEICKAGGWMPVSKPGEEQSEPYYGGGISLDHKNPSTVYLSRQVNGIFEIERRTLKGKSWVSSTITAHSTVNSMRPYVVEGYPGNKPILLWMTGIYIHYTDFHTALRINE